MKKIALGIALLSLLFLCGCTLHGNDSTQQNDQQSRTIESTREKNLEVEEAIELYIDSYPSTSITSIELKKYDGRYIYFVEGVDDSQEYSLKIDANTGAYTIGQSKELDYEDRGGVKKREDAIDLTKIMNIEEISDIVEKEVKSGKAEKWELDTSLGITYWKVKVMNGFHESEVKIDAQKGKILEVDSND